MKNDVLAHNQTAGFYVCVLKLNQLRISTSCCGSRLNRISVKYLLSNFFYQKNPRIRYVLFTGGLNLDLMLCSSMTLRYISLTMSYTLKRGIYKKGVKVALSVICLDYRVYHRSQILFPGIFVDVCWLHGCCNYTFLFDFNGVLLV